jgi:predicted lipid-binding transport protein (Tim44 family)
MLFGGLGGMGGGGGLGGMLPILLLVGLGYLGYRYYAGRRQERAARSPQVEGTIPGPYAAPSAVADTPGEDRNKGLEYIRRMDPSFDAKVFGETASDAFFRLQGGWTRRDLSPVSGLLTDEMRATLQSDADALKAKGQINRLENISVRNVEITEAWQESGQEYVTVLFQANLLDYTTDEAGKVLSGSDAVPVKFEEFWTFTRPVGPGAWRLSAIQQAGYPPSTTFLTNGLSLMISRGPSRPPGLSFQEREAERRFFFAGRYIVVHITPPLEKECRLCGPTNSRERR